MQIATKEDVNALFAELRAMRQRLDELAPPPLWLSVDAYAAKRGVSVATVYRWIRSGQLTDNGKTGKLRLVKIDSHNPPRDPTISYKVPRKLSERVFKRDGMICAYCKTTDGPFQLDHIVPWSRGGRTMATNLTVCCPSCNLKKGNKLLSEWKRPKR